MQNAVPAQNNTYLLVVIEAGGRERILARSRTPFPAPAVGQYYEYQDGSNATLNASGVVSKINTAVLSDGAGHLTHWTKIAF